MQSEPIIGTQSLSIDGGDAISAVIAEAEEGRDSVDGGFDKTQSLTVVVRTSIFQATYAADPITYEGQTATIFGRTLRIESISTGSTVTTINFSSTSKI